jgi:hypothetical protein
MLAPIESLREGATVPGSKVHVFVALLVNMRCPHSGHGNARRMHVFRRCYYQAS